MTAPSLWNTPAACELAGLQRSEFYNARLYERGISGPPFDEFDVACLTIFRGLRAAGFSVAVSGEILQRVVIATQTFPDARTFDTPISQGISLQIDLSDFAQRTRDRITERSAAA